MAKKRKHDSKSAEPTEPPQKQQQQEPKLEPEPEPSPVQEIENQVKNEGFSVEEEEEDVYEEIEEEVEEEEEEEVEEEEEEEEDNGNQTAVKDTSTAADEDEPVWNLLEPFTKEQLVNLLCKAAEMHKDVSDLICKRADEDPVHRKVFVHGLGWDTKTETLISVFKQYGEIEDCKAVTDKISGKSKGYGFILFKSRSGARKALVEPQKKIGNRITACQMASVGPVGPLGGGPPAGATSQQQQPPQSPASEYTQKKIYVSNVGADLDPQKLRMFFQQFGEIEEGPLGLDKLTGKPKGFCLFVYKSVESARKALEEPHKNFEGNILHCQRAIDGPKPGKQQQHFNNPHNKHNRNDNNAGFSGAGARAHMMAQGGAMAPAAAQGINPALGHALTALLATQGAGLGLNPALGQALLGTFGAAGGVNPGMPAPGMQAPYGAQTSMIGGYGSQSGYPNQQMGQGGSGRGQHGYGGGGPYMGH